MLYPLSYWSIFIAAPLTQSKRDSKIIAAERARLKRVRQASAVQIHSPEKMGVVNLLDISLVSPTLNPSPKMREGLHKPVIP
ncbi:MAG: hypothetical protein OXI77_07555 [Chloroflexota bacterium]|nr:hypothetical protein [Chloroflexota bacterium]MDE2908581.1 hypothetical protein [Chloroflexota bacterium]